MLQFIYAIIDEEEYGKPPEETSAYIGITNNPKLRMQQHLLGIGGNAKKNRWFQERRATLKMNILEEIDRERREGLTRERYWIVAYHKRGVQLLNDRIGPGDKKTSSVPRPVKPAKRVGDISELDMISESALALSLGMSINRLQNMARSRNLYPVYAGWSIEKADVIYCVGNESMYYRSEVERFLHLAPAM